MRQSQIVWKDGMRGNVSWKNKIQKMEGGVNGGKKAKNFMKGRVQKK